MTWVGALGILLLVGLYWLVWWYREPLIARADAWLSRGAPAPLIRHAPPPRAAPAALDRRQAIEAGARVSLDRWLESFSPGEARAERARVDALIADAQALPAGFEDAMIARLLATMGEWDPDGAQALRRRYGISATVAVLAGVRGNLAAFQAVLEDIAGRGIIEIVLLGNLIGDGPDPIACIQLSRHARMSLACPDYTRCLTSRGGWYGQVRDMLRHEEEAGRGVQHLLAGWRLGEDRDTYRAVFPVDGIRPRDAQDRERMRAIFTDVRRPLVSGSGAVPGAFVDGGATFVRPESLALDGPCLVCPGYVGLPYDGDPRATYVTIDDGTVRWHRVRYDVEQTVTRIQAQALLDDWLIHQLRSGRPE